MTSKNHYLRGITTDKLLPHPFVMLQKRLPIQFTDETIQGLFGYEDAESEPIGRLREYYFKNDTYARVTSEIPIRILVGHKGIGKSALFKISMAEEREKGNLPILIRPDDIAELGHTDENFLLKIRQWKFGLNKIIGLKVLNELGHNDPKTIKKLSSFGLKIVTFLHDSIKASTENINLEPLQKELTENFLSKKKIIVYIDDLDRGWEGKKADIARLSSLLNSIRDLSNENPGLFFKVSLRSDVYFLVRTSDESTDKIEGSVIWYSWTNHEILVMLVKRVLTFLERPFDESNLRKTPQHYLAHHLDDIIESRFHGYGKWNNIATYRILMSLIRKRPRDLVKLCTLAAREAYKNNATKIGTEHFQSIFEEYSQGRIQDTINEYRSELPNIEALVLNMKPNKKTHMTSDGFVFSTEEIKLKLNNLIGQNRFVFSNGKKAEAKELLNFLYKINFLTARKILESGEIDRKYFEENRYISNTTTDFGYNWEIHPAYRWVLKPDTIDDIFQKLSLSADS